MHMTRANGKEKKKDMKQLISRWFFGGKDPAFFRQFKARIDEHNSGMAGHLVRIMAGAALVYFVLDLNSSDSVKMRLSYLVCLLVAAVMLLLHEKIFKHITDRINVTAYYCTVMELVFVFLLFVGPVFDPTHTACYLPLFFFVSFLLPILPLQHIGLIDLVDLLIFGVVDRYCKGAAASNFDMVNSVTCAVAGLVLGRSILMSRLNEIDTYAILQESSKRELEHAMRVASTDPLTGVKNRAAYESTEQAMDKRIRTNLEEPFALLVADVNQLKKTNDSYGHEQGDALITQCSRALCRVFAHSPVFRIGGDEFAVLLKGEDYLNRDKLMVTFRQKVRAQGKGTILAGGMSDYRPREDRCLADVFRRADRLMYEDKNSGI